MDFNLPQPPPPKTNWFSAQHFLAYIFIIAAISAAVSVIYYWQTVRSLPTSYDPIIHKDPTANWKTYTNDQYGFSFKYPSDWILNTNANGLVSVSNTTKVDPKLSDLENFADGNNGSIGFMIQKSANPNLLSTRVWFSEYFKDGFSSKPESDEDITFSGRSGVRIALADMGVNIITYVPDGTNIIVISHQKADKFTAIYNQILSTFKFTDTTSVNTSDWKTYTNDQYGFSVQYPSDWETLPFSQSGTPSHPEMIISSTNPTGFLYDGSVWIGIYDNEQAFFASEKATTFEQYLTNLAMDGSESTYEQNVTLGGIKAYTVDYPGITVDEYIMAEKDGKLYYINTEDPSDLKTAAVFNHVVSTFKFTQ